MWLQVALSFWVVRHILAACDFEVVSASSLKSGFEKTQERPLLIRGLSWSTEFTSLEGFRKAFGNVTAFTTKSLAQQARTGKPPGKVETTFGKWVDELDTEGGIPYVFHYCAVHPNCDSRIETTYGIPPLMRGASARLFVAAGAASKGLPLHAAERTWGAAIVGQKVWFAAPPGNPPVEPYQRWEESDLAAAKLLQCTQEEGDVIFIPDGWWHTTYGKKSWTLTIGGEGNSEGLGYDAARGNVGKFQAVQTGMMDEYSWQSAATNAAQNGHVGVLQVFSSKGVVDLSSGGTKRDTLLHKAAQHGHARALAFLVGVAGVNGTLLDSVLDGSGGTLAHTAASSGHASVMELLADLGIDLSGQATLGHFAAVHGHAQLVQLLARKGVDMSTKDSKGWTAAHGAAKEGHAHVIETLGRIAGVNLGAKDDRGLTIGHYTGATGHTEVLEVLARNGLDFSAVDNNNATMLHHAAHFGQTRVIEFLLRKGVDPVEQASAARIAGAANHLAAVELLSPSKAQGLSIWDKIKKWWQGVTRSSSGEL